VNIIDNEDVCDNQYKHQRRDVNDLELGNKSKAEDQHAGDEARAFVDKTLDFCLDVKFITVIEWDKEEFEDGVLKRIAQCPVEEPAQRNKEEKINKACAARNPGYQGAQRK